MWGFSGKEWGSLLALRAWGLWAVGLGIIKVKPVTPAETLQLPPASQPLKLCWAQILDLVFQIKHSSTSWEMVLLACLPI